MSIQEDSPEQSAETVLDSIDAAHGDVEESDEVIEGEEEIDAEDATEEELAEVLEDEDASEEEKVEAIQELKKRMTFKINGKDVEKEIDLGDESSIRELLQKGFAADERFQKASGMEKQMKTFAELLQADPVEALKAAGHDMDSLAEKYLEKRVEDMKKSPEQLELENLQREIEVERKARESLQNEKVELEQSRAQEEYSRQLDVEITDALASSNLPKSPYVVKRLAENLMIGLEQGNEDVTVTDVLPVVEKQIQDEIRQMFEAMPEDVIEKILGNNVSTKLRKRRISRAKKAPVAAASVKPTGQSEINKASKEKEPTKTQKAKDFWSNF